VKSVLRSVRLAMLLLATFYLLVLPACVSEKHLLGEWRWSSYELDPAYEGSHEAQIMEDVKKLHDLYNKQYYKHIGLKFESDSLYERFLGLRVVSGKYKLAGKTLQLSERFLNHEPGFEFKIKKLNSKKMTLQTEQLYIHFDRTMDPEFEAAKNLEVTALDGRWTSEKNKETYDMMVILDLEQELSLLSGSAKALVSMEYIENAIQDNIEGEVAGEFVKIVITRKIKGQSEYNSVSYEYRGSLKRKLLYLKFVHLRYLNSVGETVNHHGTVELPYPRKITLKNK